MDIWNWVEKLQDDLGEAGQAQSAQLLTRLTDEVCELRLDRVDALLPEARALGKTLGNPWLDVFVGHWDMRNRVGNRLEGESALGDAVALFERAHRADTVECPQSICVTQDLAACYGNIDGPGWVPERIEVCEETLARIDPSWACFQCLSCEKADALLDDGNSQGALDYLDVQAGTVLAHGGKVYDSFPEMRIKILLASGRAAEALVLIDARQAEVDAEGDYEPANCTLPRKLSRAWALAQLGRDEEALESLVPWNQLSPNYRRMWAHTVALLVRNAPERNSWDLGRRLSATLAHYAAVGAHRFVIEIAGLCVDMALQRGAVWTARRHLALAREHLGSLRQDRGASEAVAAMAARVDTAPGAAALPVPAEGLLDWLVEQGEQGDGRDPEREAQWLLQGVEQRPDDAAMLDVAASALNACGAEDDAIALLWAFVERHGHEDAPPAYSLMGLLVQRGDQAGLDRLAQHYQARVPVFALWCQAQMAHKLSDWPALEQASSALLALSPQSHGARNLLAMALMALQRFQDAAAQYRHLTEVLEEPRSAHWDHMTAASAAGDWAAVRGSAAAIGMELESTEGPVEESFGWVIIRCADGGEPIEYYARRTGPVTARIVENAPANRRQRVDDWVVFDAELVHPAPEDEQERERFMPTYAEVHLLQRGGYAGSWLVDGVHPGEDAWTAFSEAVEARGWKLWTHSPDDYQLTDAQGDDAPLPGVLFTLAQPLEQPPLDLHRFLLEATAHWPHRLCWLRLAEACGQDEQRHVDVIERYGL